jgi:homoserine O-succinyltransferase/O-acetyltransferase
MVPASINGHTSPIRLALVNNMTDAAFLDTEAQFRHAMTTGPETDAVELALYTIAEIPRSEEIAVEIADRYHHLDELWSDPPDALIVTGTEPVQAQLPYEPYWPYLARLLEWAADAVPTTLLSCLASQVSVLLFDRIERVPRASKCSGVFGGAVADRDDPLVAGLPDLVPVPQSRLNDIPDELMLAAGYRIVIGSGPDNPGWVIASRRCAESLFVLCQGHPEYGPVSLLREYQRDVRRSLFGRGAVPYPNIPQGYFEREAVDVLEEFARRVTPDADPRRLWASFPYDDAVAGVRNTWADASATLYRNWLTLARATVAPRA